jgi:hypothetical protein
MRGRKLSRFRWVFALDLFVAALFLVFGNTTGRIIGAALLVALALLVFRAVQSRRGGGEPSPRMTVLVNRLLAVAGLFALGSGIYGLVVGEAAIAVFLLALGGYCLYEARKNLRLKPAD